MHKTRTPFHLLVLMALMLSATFQMQKPAEALLGISEKEEIQAGQQVRQQAYKEFGQPLPANHPMSQRVRAIGQRFAQLSARKNIPYSYEVLQNDEMLNAFAAPGGPVFVTTKLVNTTANDAELAYVLGHETAHIDRKHIVDAVERQQKVGLGIGILGAILGGGSASNIFQVFSNVAFTVWTRGYSRDHENESDIVGTRWMSQMGFDPNAAVSMLGRLGGGSGGGLERYLATHPAPKDRQANVQNLIQRENLRDVARRQGGPRLTASDLPQYKYSTTNTSTATYPANSVPPTSDDIRDADRASLGAPLVLKQSGNYAVVMAPVGGFARWAGAAINLDEGNTVVTISRNRNSIRMRRDSPTAVINGRNVRLSAPAAVYNDLLYAPLGALSEGVGATASLSNDNRIVWLSIDNRRAYVEIPNR